MAYQGMEAALSWLANFLGPGGLSPIDLYKVSGIWNFDKEFKLVRKAGGPPDIEDVRISYLSGKSAQGVIYLSTTDNQQTIGSNAKQRFEVEHTILITLFAIYDGSDNTHQALVTAFNSSLLVSPDMLNLGGNVILSDPQLGGGDLPDLDARYQRIRSSLRIRTQAIYN